MRDPLDGTGEAVLGLVLQWDEFTVWGWGLPPCGVTRSNATATSKGIISMDDSAWWWFLRKDNYILEPFGKWSLNRGKKTLAMGLPAN